MKNPFKSIFKNIEYRTIIRQKKDEIRKLNNTIERLLSNQKHYHNKHIDNHNKDMEARETELRNEFEIRIKNEIDKYESMLDNKQIEIERLKDKNRNVSEMYEALTTKCAELEKLRIDIAEKMKMISSYNTESINWLGSITNDITTFENSFKKLSNKLDRKLLDKK
jgi:chromosome segregation ATPase